MPTDRPRARLLDELRRREGELVALCSEAVRIPSENPPGDTTAIAGFVEQYLDRRGLPVRSYAPWPDRPNLVATIGDGRDGPRLILNSHLDEFPVIPGDWQHPPFSGHVEGGRVHGRGATDMRAGLAVSLLLAGLIRELDLGLPGELIVTFSSDEESGGRGTRWMLENVPLRADGCLIGDQCGTWAIGIGEKGGCWLRLRTAGASGHAAYGTARSAVKAMVRALATVEELEGLAVAAPEVLRPLIERQRDLVATEWGEEAPRILDRLTANVGRLEGGVSINLVADSCQAEVDVRLPIGLSTEGFVRTLRERLAAAGCDDVGIEPFWAFEPTWTRPDDRLVRTVVDNSRQVRGEPSTPVIRLGASDARWFRAAGIPTVVYGPAAHNMGGVDEYVTIDDLLTTARVHAGTIVDYLSGSRA